MATPVFQCSGEQGDRHPIEYLWAVLDQLTDDDYPFGVEALPYHDTTGTAGFPDGAGLVRRTGEPLPPFPFGGVMFVGHNNDAVNARESRRSNGLSPGDPDHPTMRTWIGLYALLERAGVNNSDVFFTNVFVGLKAGDNANGLFPGQNDRSFCGWCAAFLDEQIRIMQPTVIVALGGPAQKVLGFPARRIERRSRAGVEFNAVGLTHPSSPAYYQRLEAGRRVDVEAALLRAGSTTDLR